MEVLEDPEHDEMRWGIDLGEEYLTQQVNALYDKFFHALGKEIWMHSKLPMNQIDRIIHDNPKLQALFYERIKKEIELIQYQNNIKN
jgi:hypothetical protein